MRIRVLVFDDDPLVRAMLWAMLDRRGYEVFTFPDPEACPLFRAHECACCEGTTCADAIITDLLMPHATGLDLLRHQKAMGCKIENVALISGSWSDKDLREAARLGCKFFAKPFHTQQIYEWLESCERRLAPTRCLRAWCGNAPAAEERGQ